MKEFNAFNHALNTSRINNLGQYTGQHIYPHFKAFVDAFASLNLRINDAKQYSERELADYVFKSHINRNNIALVKNCLKRRFYVANSYLQYLYKKLDTSTIQNHFDLLNLVRTDYSELLEQIYFFKIIEPTENFERLNWRRKTKHIFQIYNDAQNFFNMLEFNNIEGVKFHDLEPYSIFAMRQLIEEMGKGILGVQLITDINNNSSKSTNMPWDFIENELKQPTPRIKVAFEISTILTIKKWSNHFIHTTATADIFLIWQALELLKKLITTINQPVKNYSGGIYCPSHNIPDIKICNYLTLRKDFEKFINTTRTPKPELKVHWVDYEKWGIEGCIMSL